MSILGGLFDYAQSGPLSEIHNSRARMLQMEAEVDAQRYAEQARSFQAEQRMKYVKSGVTLEGSPLDVLNETIRNANETVSAIRARGRASAFDETAKASSIRQAGRAALLKGIIGGASSFGQAAYSGQGGGAAPRANQAGGSYANYSGYA